MSDAERLNVGNMTKQKKSDRSAHYARHATKEVPQEYIDRLNEIVRMYNVDEVIKSDRQAWANLHQSSGATLPDATDENAFHFMRWLANAYIVHFGKHPLDQADEIEDMIYFLRELKAEVKNEEARKHRMVNELVATGLTTWKDVRSPVNIGVFVFPKWDERGFTVRHNMIKSFENAHNVWNSRNLPPKRMRGKKKKAA